MDRTYQLTILIRHHEDSRSTQCHGHISSFDVIDEKEHPIVIFTSEGEYLWDESHRPSIGSFTRNMLDAFYNKGDIV